MLGKRNARYDLARVLAFTLAVLFVLFVAQGLSHTHAKGQSEAACQLCHAAHIGSSPKVLASSLFSPLLAIGYVQRNN